MRRIPREVKGSMLVLYQSETQLLLQFTGEDGMSVAIDIGGPLNRRPLADWPEGKTLLLVAEISGHT